MTAVVLTYRCGAVPDSHRVPSCLTTLDWVVNQLLMFTLHLVVLRSKRSTYGFSYLCGLSCGTEQSLRNILSLSTR